MQTSRLSMILLSTCIISLYTACNSFLEVKPKTEIKEEDIFSTQEGFKDALHGVYILLGNQQSYGLALTQTTIEKLISSWDYTNNNLDHHLSTHNFTDEQVLNEFDQIFKIQYKTIASINAILNNLDKNKHVFKSSTLYQLIKSECLALRAFIHFDLIRLWGPIPTQPTTGNTLPYVTAFSTQINQAIPYEEFQKRIFEDLDAAVLLSKEVDPFINYSMTQMRYPSLIAGFYPEDSIYAFRYLKMNYYAIKALQARAYLWFGDHESALQAANTIISAKNQDGSIKFELGSAMDFAAKDYILTKEHIFGLYDADMSSKYQNYYANLSLKKGNTESTVKTTLYGNTGTDIRETSLWNILTLNNGTRGNVLKKYYTDPIQGNNTFDNKQIPLLRISEMYLIAAETANFTQGLAYLNELRNARGLPNIHPISRDQLLLEIIKEYRKELFAEGQAFYAYKRIQADRLSIIFAPNNMTVKYVLPMPSVENINTP